MQTPEQLINYIMNFIKVVRKIFGADLRLRKWCISQAIKALPYVDDNCLIVSAMIEDYVKHGSITAEMLPQSAQQRRRIEGSCPPYKVLFPVVESDSPRTPRYQPL